MGKRKFEVYKGHSLGAEYHETDTTFRVWAPTAEAVTVKLYKAGEGECLIESTQMECTKTGCWMYKKQGDCDGVYYTYEVTVQGRRSEAVDPYARAAGVNGRRGMVVNLAKTNPQGFTEDSYRNPPQITDAVIYEGSVRDLTVDLSGGIHSRGKFIGLTEYGTHNDYGEATGLDYIRQLGITHIQMLPIYDFETVDESMPLGKEYNWGYDPDNYNVPEGSYATNPYDGSVRIREMKQMIQTFHQNNIGVIMDVVYNHTYRTEDSNFNKIVPGYYYRSDENGFSNGSGCGNEIASERAMVRRFILDSLKYWTEEYHVDGFRFDLMGVLDIQTMNQIGKELRKINPHIYLYGEGWNGGESALPAERRATKANVPKMRGIGSFSDDLRDSIKGSVFEEEGCGFVNGEQKLENALRFGITGAVRHPQVDYEQYQSKPWACEPGNCINYVSCHDNYTLWDKLCVSAPDETKEVRRAMNRLAAAIVYTSQGVPFMQAGEEMLRSKPDKDTGGVAENSYNLPDETNSIKWNRIHEHLEMTAYYQGLIAFRKAHPALRMHGAAQIRKNLRFIDTQENVVAYELNAGAAGDTADRIRVVFNACCKPAKMTLPEGENWQVYINGERAGNNVLLTIQKSVDIAPLSALVMIKE